MTEDERATAMAQFDAMTDGDSDEMEFTITRNVPPRQAGTDDVEGRTFSFDAVTFVTKQVSNFIVARLFRRTEDQTKAGLAPVKNMRVTVRVDFD